MTEQQRRGTLGVVLVGIPPGADAVLERFAGRGYEVLVAGVEPATELERGLETVRSAIDALAGTRAEAVVGYGFGGRYAFLAVTRLGAGAGAALYGSGIGLHLAESARVKKPLTLHFGDADERVPFDEVRAIKGALEGLGTVEIYRYPGARHGFALAGHPGYDADAAERAQGRVFAILDGLLV